jgi:[acyl-carrier-protein] S-malonyltransferase
MAKYVFLFPGQGAQAPGMVKDICEALPEARRCLDAFSEAVGEDATKLLWESDAATLARSDRSQLAITAASLVVVEALKVRGITPSAAAGFSLGEFPAFCASGVLSFADTVRVVKERGRIMQEVCDAIASRSDGRAPGMAAVIGLAPDQIKAITATLDGVYEANMNSAKQTVVSGTADGLDKAAELFKAAGARRVLRLAVAGPYHSPLMQEAAVKFEAFIAGVQFNAPKIPLFSNVSGKRVTDAAEIKTGVIKHLVQPVLWTDEEAELDALMGDDDWALLETGPGKVLSGLWKDSPYGEKRQSTPVGDWTSLQL